MSSVHFFPVFNVLVLNMFNKNQLYKHVFLIVSHKKGISILEDLASCLPQGRKGFFFLAWLFLSSVLIGVLVL